MADIGTALLNRLSDLNALSDSLGRTSPARQETDLDFARVLSEALEQYRQVDNGGDYATLDLLSGSTRDLSSALIATEKAEIALSLTVAVRNKAVEAYKEIMNMQV